MYLSWCTPELTGFLGIQFIKAMHTLCKQSRIQLQINEMAALWLGFEMLGIGRFGANSNEISTRYFYHRPHTGQTCRSVGNETKGAIWEKANTENQNWNRIATWALWLGNALNLSRHGTHRKDSFRTTDGRPIAHINTYSQAPKGRHSATV